MKVGSLRLTLSAVLALIALGLLLVPLTHASPTATFTVTKTDDTNDGMCNADCSLREAIGGANTTPGSTVVVPAGIYALTIDGAGEDDNALGDLDLKADMTINGAGLTTTIIHGGEAWTDRLLHLTAPTVSVQIDGLTLREGHISTVPAFGGGIYNNGHLTLTHSAVLSNTALAGGSGLYNYGWLTTLETTIAGNTTPESGGGLANGGSATLSHTLLISNSAASQGGGIYNTGTLVIDGGTLALNHAAQAGGAVYVLGSNHNRFVNSTIVTNSAAFGGGLYLNFSRAAITATLFASNTATTSGGAINSASSPMPIVDSQFISNTAGSGNGGGLYGGNFYVTRTIVSGNQAQFGGGVYANALVLTDSVVQGNRALQNGGGLYVLGSATLNHAVLISNTAQNGGGFFNYGSFSAQDTLVRGNSATTNGGGFYNAAYAVVDRSLIVANHAASGGGLGTRDTLTLTNSTLSGNSVSGLGGGLLNDTRTSVTPTTHLRSVTLVSNTAQSNGGGLVINNNGGTIDAANSLIAYNTGLGGAHDCVGTLNSLGYNLIQHVSGCVITNTLTGVLTNTAPLLDVLHDNGGATWTHALISGSVAIDAGHPAPIGSGDGTCLVTDQRGVARSGGGRCDLGAFELSFLQAQTITFDPIPDRLVTDDPFIITATASSGLSVTVTSLTASVCTVSNKLVTLVATGTCTLRASQPGNTTYAAAANVDRSFTVKPGYKLYLPLIVR